MNRAQPFLATEGQSHIFGIALRRIATLSALGYRDEHYLGGLFARQVDWLTCLVNSRDERMTYDLRILSSFDSCETARGKLALALLCCARGMATGEAREQALDTLRLCEAYFEDEYEFASISSGPELERLLRPFQIYAITEITRRTELAALDALRGEVRKRGLGFSSQSAAVALAPQRVYHIYPFIPNPASMVLLCRLLLMQNEPLAVSFRMRPAALEDGESAFLEQQIVRCERYAQVSVSDAGDNLESIHPTLQEQARIFQRHILRSLYALKDNAALLTVQIAGPGRVPQNIVDALGGQLTQPAGGSAASENLETYLSGGYEFCPLRGEALSQAASSFSELGITPSHDQNAPPEAARMRALFDAAEASSVFRFPAPSLEELPGVAAKTSRTQLASAFGNGSGHLIGHSVHNNRVEPIRLSRDDRRRHLYAVGQTGTGKTTMSESMIMADILAGEGVCVLDPHGDLIEKLLPKIPQDRAGDVVILDPGDLERPVGFNLLEYESEAQKYFLIQELVAIVERLLQQVDPAMGGPMFYQHMRMVLLLVMSNPEESGTLLQFYQVFNSQDFYKRFLPLRSRDPFLDRFVEEVLSRTDYVRQSSEGGSFGSYVSSKFEGFVSDPMLRNIFGQRRSAINPREIMDSGKILLVNLSKGRLGEVNSRFFGMVLIAKLQAAAMARASQPIEQRRDFYLYVDEFQNLATPNFGVLLSEARKYRLNLILTNQYVSQVDAKITSAIAGSVGTTISFRVGPVDAELLEREFLPAFNRYDLMNLPNFNTCVSTLIDGQVSKAFSMRTILDESPVDEGLGAAVRELSRVRYGKPRRKVESEIAQSLSYAAGDG